MSLRLPKHILPEHTISGVNEKDDGMAEATPQLESVIKRYISSLESMGIRVERVYLFGSYKDGTAREGSDIDLVIISRDWDRYDYLERLRLLGVAAARILEPVEAQGFTPEELAGGELTSFWKHVMENEAVEM